jgi:circadian clock protein KaiC
MSVERMPTGVPGLDEVLGGGLLPGALIFVAGVPGAGKTVLAQQMAFASARRGVPAVYFTTLGEPHDKLLRHIGGFGYYDQALLGEGVLLLNLEQSLRQGIEETAEAIVQTARAQRARLVVLDALRGVSDLLGGGGMRARELLYQLSAKLGLLGVCCVVTFETDALSPGAISEFVTADVVLALQFAPSTGSRRLEVLKARGSAPLPGSHSFRIAGEGVAVFPQTESLSVRPAAGVAERRAAFGIAALDVLMQGGPTAGTSTVIAGAPGTGKTLLALDWLQAGAASGEPGLLVGFHENADRLLDRADALGQALREHVEAGRIDLWTRPPIALDGDQLASELRDRVATRGVRRLVVDSARELESSVGSDRAATFLIALVAYLRGEGVSALLTYEISNKVGIDLDFAGTPAAVLAENLLFLRQTLDDDSPRRVLAVLEMRYSGFNRALHLYDITDRGIRVGAPLGGPAATTISGEDR